MKTTYFISSRSCSDDRQRYKDYLLHHDNMVEDGEITIPVLDNGRDFVEQVKLKARDQNIVENFSQNRIIRRLFAAINKTTATEEEKSNLVNENLELLISEGIVKKQEERQFRKVYRLEQANSDSEWQLYGVYEINKSDAEKNVKIVRPQWCDKLIDYILDKNSKVEDVHLFLHDGDIEGYSDNTHILIDGAEECCNRKLIDQKTKDALKGKNLTIVFFKHVSPCIMEVIGPQKNRKLEDIPTKFKMVLDQLRGVSELMKTANEEYVIISESD